MENTHSTPYEAGKRLSLQGLFPVVFLAVFITFFSLSAYAQSGIDHNPTLKKIKIAAPDPDLAIEIDYSQGCRITQLNIKGQNTLSPSGVYTGFRTKGGVFSSSADSGVTVKEIRDGVIISNIVFGDDALKATETWCFRLDGNKILWDIDREYSILAKLEESYFPQWNFANLSVWKGGIMDNGGMVWCKYLGVNDAYGVHTGGVTFWNPESGDGLRIVAKPGGGKFIAAKYAHSDKGEFTCTQVVTDVELESRYDLSRFVHQRADVFNSFNVDKGNTKIGLELQYVDYAKEYSRGNLPGIDAVAVRELLNTTGRYGVVDNKIIGGNGWITNWKCMHEPFFAQIGMALNDENYVRNMSSTLDSERDYALTQEGRMLSRWHNADEDQMPGTFNYKTGYYEAKWGYTVDSQTGYIINTAEQFDLCGDVEWLRGHKAGCEKALDWLIRRDSNGNGIFEMVNSSVSEEEASDWLDIVWASFENGFVNIQMYEALNLWADCESVLGDKEKAEYYKAVAGRLKENFNKPVSKGGFWYPEKKQYIYWRDKDGSIHGDNMVTPVNFAVIAFGLCDDQKRISIILDEIERRTAAENLFHWPLCFDSFKREEVSGGNWPFPTYENGDIFPSWGYLGVRAYVGYDKEIALKYIRRLLAQYNKDGLSSQRYARETQLGQGSDILAGICTSVTALYRDIYGIRPKWNRMGLEPNMVQMLNGTEFTYTLRGTIYNLKLSVNDYEMSCEGFRIRSKENFGVDKKGNKLTFYPNNEEHNTLEIYTASATPVDMQVNAWKAKERSWTITSAGGYEFKITGLQPDKTYKFSANNKTENIKCGKEGSISMKHEAGAATVYTVR